jgi:hypothetical protein
MSSVWDWSRLVIYAISLSPWLLVMLIGAGLCLRHAGDQRRRSVLIGIALLIQIASTVAGLFATQFVFEALQKATDSIEVAQMVLGLLHSLPSAVALLLMLFAAFYGDPHPHYGSAAEDSP